ncbi:hypothetical protein IFM47457_00393 [Aspergillus lentulus]|nr:hypothetical protein IFM47457_00393 [Aspergillus lentulus]
MAEVRLLLCTIRSHMEFLLLKFYAWCSTKANPVGAGYIIMEKLDGIPLGEIWYTMTPKQQHKIMKQIVEWEVQFMPLEFPAFGSLYYQKGLPTERKVPLPHQWADGTLPLVARSKEHT